MTIEVAIGGRTRRVAARRESGGWIVELDGRELFVDLAAANERWSLLVRLPDGGPAASYEVAFESRPDGGQVVYVDGRAVRVATAGARERFGRRRHELSATASVGRLSAAMPGRVVKILVKPGDAVSPGQPVAVVEAMKMENEIRAQGHGTVTEVRAREGMSIEAHAVLVVVE